MKFHRVIGYVLGVSAAVFAVACAHPATSPPAATPAPSPQEAPTTTTSAVVPQPTGSGGLSVSEELRKACQLRFDDVPQAPKFDFDASDLQPSDRTVLDQIAKCLTTGPLAGRSVRLVGRADPRGENEYNFVLGSHRANSVERYLQNLGVSSAKMSETSRGKLDATGTDEDGWQRDRRVDIDLAP